MLKLFFIVLLVLFVTLPASVSEDEKDMHMKRSKLSFPPPFLVKLSNAFDRTATSKATTMAIKDTTNKEEQDDGRDVDIDDGEA